MPTRDPQCKCISSGSFSSVWQSTDGHDYGVSSLDVNVSPSSSEPDSNSCQDSRDWLNRDMIEFRLISWYASLFKSEGQKWQLTELCSQITKPVIGSYEHGPLVVGQSRSHDVAHARPTSSDVRDCCGYRAVHSHTSHPGWPVVSTDYLPSKILAVAETRKNT